MFSGGLGYIISIIYFGCNWFLNDRGKGILYNHLDVINELVDSKKLKIINTKGNEIIGLNKRDAWYITNVMWHSRTNKYETVKGVHDKLDTYYSDITTGLATTFTASVLSCITFLVLLIFGFYNEPVCCFAICHKMVLVLMCIFFFLVFIYLVRLNHLRTYKAYESMINSAFATEITSEFEEINKFVTGNNLKSPITFVYSKD